MRKLLKTLWVIREKEIEDTNGRMYSVKRMNPFNPLTYVTIVIAVILGLLMFGVVGIWDQVDTGNPFRWRP